MIAIIDLKFQSVMGIRISEKSGLIKNTVANATEQNVKEICTRLEKYFREKTIDTDIRYMMAGCDAQVKIVFLMIGQIPVTKELLKKEKGLIASTERTVGKLCDMLEELFGKKGIQIKTKFKVFAE